MKQNHELTEAQEKFRRGSTSMHATRALTAKKILAEIRKSPGLTKEEIFKAAGITSGHGGFDLITAHRQAYYAGSPARWYPHNHVPNGQ